MRRSAHRIFIEFFRKVRTHGHHIIFIVSIISLASLSAWWSIFIHNSIQKHRAYHYQSLDSDLRFFSLRLGLREDAPTEGLFKQDERFEITPFSKSTGKFFERLEPNWPEFCLRVRESVLLQVENKFKRQNFMLVGESGLLLLIIFVSSIFLYRFIQLERRSTKEVRNFWEHAAHEIKTPITGIKAFLQSLKPQFMDDGELQRFVDLALKQVDKQEQLAENILSGYYLRAKDSQLRLMDIELIEFLKDYFDKSALHLVNASVNRDFEKNRPVRVRGDVHSLKVILDNITHNAVKYCQLQPVLDIEVLKEKRGVSVTITDNGPGFAPQMRKRIFEAYKHLGGGLPTRFHGSGIGLYISRHLARKMGGNLEAFSQGEGKGAQFKLQLLC